MRVLLIGAYGFIGSAIARRLNTDGHVVRALGRSRALGESRLPGLEWVEGDLNRMVSPADWAPLLVDIDAVVNASGALQSGSGDRLSAVQRDSIIALIAACEASGRFRFVQISVPDAACDDTLPFMATKAAADRRLADSSLDWAILRPTLVIGRDAYGGTMLIRALAVQPGLIFLSHGAAKVQAVALSEVVEAVSTCLCGDLRGGVDAVLSERPVHELKALVLAHRRWLGLPPPWTVIDLPLWAARPISGIADALGRLGWRSPLRSTALAMVARGVTGDASSGEALLGRPLAGLETSLATHSAGAQDRLQARMTLLLPLIVGALALLWLWSGLLGLARLDAVVAELEGTGLAPGTARGLAIAGSAVDVVLGLGILVRNWVRPAALGMIAVTIAYLTAGSLLRPDLWLDPLAPLVKAIPAMALAVVTLVATERR